MRRLNVVLSDRAAEQLDELREFWRETTGQPPSPDVLIQRALEEYHHSCLGAAGDRGQETKKPSRASEVADPQERARWSEAS